MPVTKKAIKKSNTTAAPTKFAGHADGDSTASFTGKNSAPANLDDIDALKTPEELGVATASALRKSTVNILYACKFVSYAFKKFKDDEQSLARYGKVLVDEHVIDQFRSDADSSSKLSMLKKVGDNFDLLSRSEISDYTHGGYSVLYQILKLHEALQHDTEKLFAFIAGHVGRLSRERLIEEIKLIEADTRRAQQSSSIVGPRLQGTTVNSVVESGRRANFVLITPTAEDIRRIAQDYQDRETAPRCLRVHEAVEDNAVAAVVVELRCLPVIAGKLLPYCGFEGISQVLLAESLEGPDITTAKVVVTAERGRGKLIVPADEGWDASGGLANDPTSLAAKLAPNASNRLHVFAERQIDDWDCVLEQDAWIEKPSLRDE